MNKFLSYNDFLTEDFTSVGSVSGMGDVAAPTTNTTGSGDSWPSLIDGVWTANGLVKKKKTRKLKRKKKNI